MDTQTIQQHGLTPDEYDRILKILGREPNLLELGIFSVMWSEHCSYKSSRIYLKKLPTKGRQVICGPGENAGVVDIGDGLVVVFKMESHNHPSFIEPYQGAATGVGGILRDVFTMGARPIALLNSLRFGAPDHPKTSHLVNGVVAGISGYGNCMGIPTVGGEVGFDACYNGNILVNAMCVGVAPKNRIFYAKAAGIGNPVIYVGAKTGRDGIHGATMASDVFDETSEEKRPTVQVGDPFTEKLVMEACLELMNGKDVVGIQDMGAAGLTCSSMELAGKGRVGIEMDLAHVPLREEGMTPYEIMLSESQERMFLVSRKGSEKRILKLFKKWDLDAAVVGKVIRGDQVVIRHNGALVGHLPTLPITENAPLYKRPVKRPAYFDLLKNLTEGDLRSTGGAPSDLNQVLLKLMGSANLSSKKWVYRQYDHMVGDNTLVLPGSDAAVVRLKEPHTEGRKTKKGLAITTDCNSRYCYLDPRMGGRIAVAEAARNIVCSGGKPLAVTDCLNFGSPENPEVMWQFRESLRGISEACRAFKTPIVSGNVSFYNESIQVGGNAAPSAYGGRGPHPPEPLSFEPAKPDSRSLHQQMVSIYPTPTIGMIGLLDDVSLHCTQWYKEEGDVIVLLGSLRTGRIEDLGGSEYLQVCHGLAKGRPSPIRFDVEKKVQDVCFSGIQKGWIRSAHDCSEGGLAVALAESCITGPRLLGANVIVGAGSSRPGARTAPLQDVAFLFGETQSRIIVTVSESHLQSLLKVAKVKKCPAKQIGVVSGKHLRISGLVDVDLKMLYEKWSQGFEKIVNKD